MKPRRSRLAAYAIIHSSGRILLCRLSKELPRWEGSWTLPGGGVEFGESPEEAMIREVGEETGLRVEATSVAKIDSILDCSGASDFHGVRIIYHVRVVSGTLRHEPTGSTDRCEWHPLHPPPDIKLVGLAQVGIKLAQDTWPPGTLQIANSDSITPNSAP